MSHPFLDPAFSIRWSELTPDRVKPDLEEALIRARAAIEAIAARDSSELSYDSTFFALDQATEELDRAWSKVSHLQSVADSPALREAYNAMLPAVSAFYAGIPLHAELWLRLKGFASSPAGEAMAGVRRRHVTETMAEFRDAGADLSPEARARLETLQAELAAETQKFSENVLDATNSWQMVVEDPGRLAGLPDHALSAARQSASAKGLGTAERPAWRFSLHAPSIEPFLTYVHDESLRRDLWSAASAVGAAAPHDNTALIARILALRAEKAALLGRADFAEVVLARRMAKSGGRVGEFLEDLRARSAGAFARECAELESFAHGAGSGPAGGLAPWSLGFWAEKLRRARYDFDPELLRPYFPIDGVVTGMFELARRLFGLRITGGTAEGWHPDVKYYDVRDEGGRHIGSFYADWHPRESKRGGAWMNSLITGGPRRDGSRAPHLGLICGNLTPPTGGRPALLTHREVETIFHEFGHLLHHLFGEVEVRSLNGINVPWDFVELPSQIMENWCWEREGLDLFARHYQTGAPIPAELFGKMMAAKNFRSACAMMRQVAFARMDLILHVRSREFAAYPDVEGPLRAAVADCLIPTRPPAPTIIKRFTHIFADPVGYAAGYYSYKWSEVLDADAFTRFRREGIFNRRVGAEFVDKILSRGHSDDPARLFRDFMGRDPDLGALLERSGLKG